jgi:hypothetical protein
LEIKIPIEREVMVNRILSPMSNPRFPTMATSKAYTLNNKMLAILIIETAR